MTSLTCRGFWTSAEAYEALQRYADMDFDGVATDIVTMLGCQHVPANVMLFENDVGAATPASSTCPSRATRCRRWWWS